jgi:hypothetical protein
MDDGIGGMPGRAPLMLALLLQVSLIGVFLSLSGAFMSAQVIFFARVLGAGTVGMAAKVAAFGSYLLGFAHNIVNARIVPSPCSACFRSPGRRANRIAGCIWIRVNRHSLALSSAGFAHSLIGRIPGETLKTGLSRALDHPVQE